MLIIGCQPVLKIVQVSSYLKLSPKFLLRTVFAAVLCEQFDQLSSIKLQHHTLAAPPGGLTPAPAPSSPMFTRQGFESARTAIQ